MLAFPKGERKGIIYPLSLLRVPFGRAPDWNDVQFRKRERKIWQTASFRLSKGLPTARSAMGKNLSRVSVPHITTGGAREISLLRRESNSPPLLFRVHAKRLIRSHSSAGEKVFVSRGVVAFRDSPSFHTRELENKRATTTTAAPEGEEGDCWLLFSAYSGRILICEARWRREEGGGRGRNFASPSWRCQSQGRRGPTVYIPPREEKGEGRRHLPLFAKWTQERGGGRQGGKYPSTPSLLGSRCQPGLWGCMDGKLTNDGFLKKHTFSHSIAKLSQKKVFRSITFLTFVESLPMWDRGALLLHSLPEMVLPPVSPPPLPPPSHTFFFLLLSSEEEGDTAFLQFSK